MLGECNCAELSATTDGNADRVNIIAEAAPGCGCERQVMSLHSPGIVEAHETVVRMVCVPMHVHKKKAELLPSFFGHAFTYGLSAQRLERATTGELVEWLNTFVGASDDRVWLGHVEASALAIRQVRRVDSEEAQAFCVYDAAIPGNSAHVEVGASTRIIDEADRIEARSRLRKAFSDGKIVPRDQLKAGAVLQQMDAGLAGRQVPAQWANLTA